MGFPGIDLSTIAQRLGQQQQAPDPQAQSGSADQPQPKPQQQAAPDNDQIEQLKQSLAQQAMPKAQPSGGPIRRLLQNFIGGMGQSMMHEAGLPTDYEKQQRAMQNYTALTNAQQMAGLHQAMASQYQPVPLVGLDGKPLTMLDGTPVTLPAAHANTWYQGQLAAAARITSAQIQAGPPVNTTPEMQNMGLPSQLPIKQAATAQGMIQKQEGMIPVSDEIRTMFHLPPGVQTIPASSFIRAMGFMMPQTKQSFEWKQDPGTGAYIPLPTKSVTTRGTQQVSSGGGGVNLPAPVQTNQPIYAFDPQTQETRLTTPQEAQANGYTNPRKVTQKGIDEDRQLNNRLTDVATKITRYEDSINQPIDAADRTFIASLLQTDKLKVGLGGMELPVDKLNQIFDAIHQSQLSPAAQNRLIAYFNARESMLGYQRVLAGSARSSDSQLNLNLGALPGPISPDGYAKEGLRQFKENIPIAGRGLPRMPGIPTAGDVLSPKVQFREGNDTYAIPASRVEAFRKSHPQAVPIGR